LATSHECPRILHHKTALSLAATENISLTEAFKLVNSSPPYSTGSPSSNPRFDFINFPYLPRQRPSPTSDPNVSLSNRFSPLSNLSLFSMDSSSFYSPIFKPYSSAAKNLNPNSSHSLNRLHPPSRFNLISGHSGPLAGALRHPYPKAHRDLLFNPNGRFPPFTINSSAPPLLSQPFSEEPNTLPPYSDSPLADIPPYLSHSELLRHLYDLLGGSLPPIPVAVHDTPPPSSISGLSSSSKEPHHSSLRSHAPPTRP